jgi:hypothetical protein
MNQELKDCIKLGIKEAVLEFLRVIEFSVIPVILTGINTETGAIHINIAVVLAFILVAFIKAVDKGFHKSGIVEKGLARF